MTWQGNKALRTVLARSGRHRRALPLLILLGILGSLAESFGLSLIVLLLGIALGGAAGSAAGGLLGRIEELTLGIGGGNSTFLAVMIVVFILMRIAMNMVSGLMHSRLRHALSEEMRLLLFDAYLHMPYGQLRRANTGTLHDTVALHSWALADAFGNIATIGANLGSIAVFGLFVAALSPMAAVIAVIGSVLLFALTARLHRRTVQLGGDSIAATATMTERLLHSIEGSRTIRAYGRERWAARRFRAASTRTRRLYEAIERMQILLHPLNEIAYLVLLGGIALGSSALGTAPAATFAAVLLLYRMQPQLRGLESSRLALAGHDASIAAVERQLGRRAASLADGTRPYPGLGDGLAFEDVRFRYDPQTPLLEGVSFVIPPRGLTVLRGPSGIGKTTLINLILRLYEPQAGRIAVGGVAVQELRRADWLAALALAGQDAELIPGTIAQNIRFGRLNADGDALDAAIELAGLAEVLPRLADGLNTPVGGRGTNLSGGQRQRVGLARALLRNPDILILDEATNSVEQGLESAILNRIVAARQDRMTILITHRDITLAAPATVIDLTSLPGIRPMPS